MRPIEQNQEVVMQASAIRPRRPVVPPSYSLRAFEPRDAAAWVEIQAAADEYNVITPELFEAAFGSDEAMHRERIFMACDALGTPVGTAAAWVGDGAYVAFGRLHWVAVLPEHQGRGVGHGLVHQCMNRLVELGHTEAYLTTSAARLAAIHVYDACGFRARVESPEDRVAWDAIARALDESGRPLAHRVA